MQKLFSIVIFLALTITTLEAQISDYQKFEDFIVDKLYTSNKPPKRELSYAKEAARQVLDLYALPYFNDIFISDIVGRTYLIKEELLPPRLKNKYWEGVNDPNFKWRSRKLSVIQLKQKYNSIAFSWLVEFLKNNR